MSSETRSGLLFYLRVSLIALAGIIVLGFAALVWRHQQVDGGEHGLAIIEATIIIIEAALISLITVSMRNIGYAIRAIVLILCGLGGAIAGAAFILSEEGVRSANFDWIGYTSLFAGACWVMRNVGFFLFDSRTSIATPPAKSRSSSGINPGDSVLALLKSR